MGSVLGVLLALTFKDSMRCQLLSPLTVAVMLLEEADEESWPIRGSPFPHG